MLWLVPTDHTPFTSRRRRLASGRIENKRSIKRNQKVVPTKTTKVGGRYKRHHISLHFFTSFLRFHSSRLCLVFVPCTRTCPVHYHNRPCITFTRLYSIPSFYCTPTSYLTTMPGSKLSHHRVLSNCLSVLFSLLLIALPFQVSAQSCYDNFYDIYEQEAIVTDTTFPRLYTVCPRRIYEIATLDFNGNIKEATSTGVLPPLPLRANMTIRCGDVGSRDSMCWLAGGDIHMDGTAIRGINDPTIEGVSIEGFVFIGARRHSLWATKPGDITFKDCEWRVSIVCTSFGCDSVGPTEISLTGLCCTPNFRTSSIPESQSC